jgi:hypothetical protein
MRMRRPRPVHQPDGTERPGPVKPLVVGPPAHPVPPAQRRKTLFSSRARHHEPYPLIHRTGLSPSHRQGPPCRYRNLSPMCPVYSVTHPPGSDLTPTLSAGGRGGRTRSVGGVRRTRGPKATGCSRDPKKGFYEL